MAFPFFGKKKPEQGTNVASGTQNPDMPSMPEPPAAPAVPLGSATDEKVVISGKEPADTQQKKHEIHINETVESTANTANTPNNATNFAQVTQETKLNSANTEKQAGSVQQNSNMQNSNNQDSNNQNSNNQNSNNQNSNNQNSNKRDENNSGTNNSEPNTPGTNNSETNKSGADNFGTNKSRADNSVPNDPGADKSEASKSGTESKPKETDVINVAEHPSKYGIVRDDEARELKSDSFYLDLRPKVIKLPPFEDKKTIDVRYPLVSPFAFAHIHWDEQENELIYEVEEPKLDDTEKQLLELIRLGLEEMINISFVRATKSNIILQYLEKNVQSILVELGTKVSKKTYQKLMYYIYRNSVGLNQIEPLLNDYYVEDIECNGVNFPLYIVHRKYQNLRTNVLFPDSSEMTDFVEKLAQKTGRYISYAKPLLDGTLPDGSRVNATYTEDITTRGPTFTIRKFTKEPWTPVHLIQTRTASPESFAYIWMAIENKFNVMVVGETASGKTTYLNCIVDFIPPEARICSIEDTRELNLAHINWLPAVTRAGFGMPTVLGTQYGEITLFDLLRESFRQNPDYVIVGEIRGKESYVLFQGMASGHPSFSTFHAASVETVVKRLETPPINLSPSLVEALDVVCICIHVKDQNKNMRRLKEIDEIKEISQSLGKADYNPVVEWDALKDVHSFQPKGKSVIFEKIKARTGMTEQEAMDEFRKRTELLKILAEKNIVNFEEFTKVINDYYKDPAAVLNRFGVK